MCRKGFGQLVPAPFGPPTPTNTQTHACTTGYAQRERGEGAKGLGARWVAQVARQESLAREFNCSNQQLRCVCCFCPRVRLWWHPNMLTSEMLHLCVDVSCPLSAAGPPCAWHGSVIPLWQKRLTSSFRPLSSRSGMVYGTLHVCTGIVLTRMGGGEDCSLGPAGGWRIATGMVWCRRGGGRSTPPLCARGPPGARSGHRGALGRGGLLGPLPLPRLVLPIRLAALALALTKVVGLPTRGSPFRCAPK